MHYRVEVPRKKDVSVYADYVRIDNGHLVFKNSVTGSYPKLVGKAVEL